MGRKKGFDNKKIGIIISILLANPDGIWLRRIAEEAKLSPATVAHYIETVLVPFVEDVSIGKEGKPLLRVIRLKPFVAERLKEGKSLNQIMKFLGILRKIE
ncbi:MAG: hypothetical protein QXD48_01730 [Candidatus Aenigmatarchaeota archaeon]